LDEIGTEAKLDET